MVYPHRRLSFDFSNTDPATPDGIKRVAEFFQSTLGDTRAKEAARAVPGKRPPVFRIVRADARLSSAAARLARPDNLALGVRLRC